MNHFRNLEIKTNGDILFLKKKTFKPKKKAKIMVNFVQVRLY